MSKTNILVISLLALVLISGTYYFTNMSKQSDEPVKNEIETNLNENSNKKRNGYGNNDGNKSRGNCLADDCLAINDLEYPVTDLPVDAITALNSALDDEYKAFATYDAVINEFGNVRPFIMIIRAEEQHIASLKSIFDKYGLDIPENPYINKITIPDSLNEACSIGVQAEIENASLYKDELLPSVSEYDDITMVFTNLMNASQEKHLPAFQRCSN